LEQKVHMLEGSAGQAGRRTTGESFTAGGPSMDSVSPTSPVADSPIRGQVTELRGDLATISVGSSDGVAEGMLFVIYRGFDYVCDLRVSKVEPNMAAGVILNASTDPRVGDSVADQSRFGFAGN
jgi:hypothetical protein